MQFEKSDSTLDIGCKDMSNSVENLVKSYPDVFTPKIGRMLAFQYDIRLKDTEVVNIRPYPVHPTKMSEMKGSLKTC